jgi:two-component system KDP operon response regulator KdpE
MRNKEILIVDDEESILNSFRKDLKMENYNVTTALSGEEAIKSLQSRRLDLVVQTLSCPELMGYGYCGWRKPSALKYA